MGAVVYRARSELRTRWASTLALALLVGLVGAVSLTAVAGTRRSSSAYDRFRKESRSADAQVIVTNLDRALREQVAQLPQVETAVAAAVPVVSPEGSDLTPGLDFLAITDPDGRVLESIDRVRVIEGRLPDDNRADEMVISERVADDLDLAVGDRVPLQSLTPEQFEVIENAGDSGEPAGPTVSVTLVGIVRSPVDLAGDTTSKPGAYLTPAFHRTYRDRIGFYEGASRVRLRGGDEDFVAFQEAVEEIYGDDPELEVLPASEETEKVDDAVGVLVTGLLLFGAVATLAGLVAVGQAFGRHLLRTALDEPVLAGLGLTRLQRSATVTLSLLPACVGGAVLAVIGVVLASPLMPVSIARQAEPDPGLSLDGAVLGLGAAGVAMAALGLAVAVAWRTTKTASFVVADETSGRARPSAVARGLAAAGFAAPATTGARMAFEPGRGRTAVPVRSALLGAAVGVAGVVAAIVFAASLTDLVDTPERYGWNWDVSVPGEDGDVLVDRFGAELAADPTIGDLASVRIAYDTRIGDEMVLTHGFQPLKGSVTPTVIEGRSPRGPDEVVLGTDTLRRLDTSIGDTVAAQGVEGPLTLRVVGRGSIPYLDTDTVDRGALMTRQGVDRLSSPFAYSDLVLTWAPGTDKAAAQRRLEEQLGGPTFAPRPPANVTNLDRVGALPFALTAFLATLAALAVGHALVVTVRRRRRDLAVLRVVGFVPLQVSATVAWQATLMVLVGLVVGVPVGVAAGRWAWGLVASGVGAVDAPTTPLLALVLLVPAALLVANLVAAIPAWAAARTRPATALRGE